MERPLDREPRTSAPITLTPEQLDFTQVFGRLLAEKWRAFHEAQDVNTSDEGANKSVG